jgi:predicted dehydrogenase
VIATPHATHYEITRYCLEHDLHVMLEKPMTLYAAHARALVEAAKAHQRELIIGYPFNFAPIASRARDVLQAGELGPIQYVSCIFTSQIWHFVSGSELWPGQTSSPYPVHGPGAVYSNPELSGGGEGHLQITHSAGLMFFVTRLRAKRVHALMNNYGLPLDLIDAMTVEFDGGILGTVGGCGHTGSEDGGRLQLLVYCERGFVDLDMVAERATIHRQGQPAEDFGKEGVGHDRRNTVNNLVDVILGRAANGSPAEIGWRTVELLDAAYRSAKQDGQATFIDTLYDESVST